ncbi:hypothetical protein I4641_14890 [Waterburya agarophytonicola K14]|uniref:General stress protein 17M-like domain-containing protein n=1 Tax=Waterburya agarophytonicola KI4 TaxID=2874699 RepID=A0A964BUU1_9CYAN|nr:hypothetical protein [Waterburya agarophytonicola]MCC0178265.1 hypothetical protein [Waterburya agarophytonicola KI4]
MTDNNLRRAVGTFPTRQDAEMALIELKDAGFDMDRISAIAQNPESDDLADVEVQSSESRAKEGLSTGAVLGGTTGGILGLIGSLSVLAIPGVGIATEAAVLLGNALLGSGIGAAGGSLIGALIGWGIPEEQAVYYHELLSKGSYVVLVEGTEAEINGAKAILLNNQIDNWNVYNAPGDHSLTGF